MDASWQPSRAGGQPHSPCQIHTAGAAGWACACSTGSHSSAGAGPSQVRPQTVAARSSGSARRGPAADLLGRGRPGQRNGLHWIPAQSGKSAGARHPGCWAQDRAGSWLGRLHPGGGCAAGAQQRDRPQSVCLRAAASSAAGGAALCRQGLRRGAPLCYMPVLTSQSAPEVRECAACTLVHSDRVHTRACQAAQAAALSWLHLQDGVSISWSAVTEYAMAQVLALSGRAPPRGCVHPASLPTPRPLPPAPRAHPCSSAATCRSPGTAPAFLPADQLRRRRAGQGGGHAASGTGRRGVCSHRVRQRSAARLCEDRGRPAGLALGEPVPTHRCGCACRRQPAQLSSSLSPRAGGRAVAASTGPAA